MAIAALCHIKRSIKVSSTAAHGASKKSSPRIHSRLIESICGGRRCERAVERESLGGRRAGTIGWRERYRFGGNRDIAIFICSYEPIRTYSQSSLTQSQCSDLLVEQLKAIDPSRGLIREHLSGINIDKVKALSSGIPHTPFAVNGVSLSDTS